MGAVFNRVDAKKGGYYQYYNYYNADGYYSDTGSNGHHSRNGKSLKEAAPEEQGITSPPAAKE